jgi:dUTP pyrophosphatase
MRNGKNLIEEEIITGPIGEDNVAQHGIDLNVIEIHQVFGGGIIPTEGKTVIGKSEKVDLTYDAPNTKRNFWLLQPGVYDLKFAQGCNIPPDMMMLIRQRSSLLRNGAILHSSVFDAGFKTKNIGTIIVVNTPIMIEYGARVAQIYGHTCTPVENLYDGQWQGDKQRQDEKKN